MKRLTKHLQHYLPLISILSAGILGFMVFSFDRTFQAAVMFATAAGYVTWGIVHHHIHKDLQPSVVIEYVVIAFLGVVIIFSVIFRA